MTFISLFVTGWMTEALDSYQLEWGLHECALTLWSVPTVWRDLSSSAGPFPSQDHLCFLSTAWWTEPALGPCGRTEERSQLDNVTCIFKGSQCSLSCTYRRKSSPGAQAAIRFVLRLMDTDSLSI